MSSRSLKNREALATKLSQDVFDCVLDPSSWPAFSEDLSQLFSATTNLIGVRNLTDASIDLLSHKGFGVPELIDYGRYFYRSDPWTLGAMRFLNQAPRAWTGQELIEDRLFERSETYVDFCKPRLNIFHLIGTLIPMEEDKIIQIGLHRARSAGMFGVEDRRLLERVMPSIRQALMLRERLNKAEGERDATRGLLDYLTVGLALVAKDGVVKYANRAMQTIAAARDGFTLGSRLTPASCGRPDLTQRLLAAIFRAATDRIGSCLRLTRPSGAAPFAAFITPLPLAEGEALCALYLFDPALLPAAPAARLAALFALSPAESQLAESLASGARLEDVAEQRGVQLSTLRTQLTRIFEKTGTTRQSELVGLLSRLAILS